VRRLLPITTILLLLLIGTSRGEVPTTQQTYSNATGLLNDIADPFVLKQGKTYFLYGTSGRGLRVWESNDLVAWSAPTGATNGYALSPKDSWGNKWWWAPEVVERNGTFYMYYSVEEHLAVATSKSPRGPFVQPTKEPMHPQVKEIDGHVFIDDDGKAYLFFAHIENGLRIQCGELTGDMLSIKPDSIVECIRPSQSWETDPVNEGPFVLKHKGTYYLMYSGNAFTNPMYGIGYATAPSIHGPWTKYAKNPILKASDDVRGPGHHCVTTSPDGSELFIVYHTHHDRASVHPRKLAIDRMQFVSDPNGGPDIIQVVGPTITPQPMPSAK
jgi:beta-xylosidase